MSTLKLLNPKLTQRLVGTLAYIIYVSNLNNLVKDSSGVEGHHDMKINQNSKNYFKIYQNLQIGWLSGLI